MKIAKAMGLEIEPLCRMIVTTKMLFSNVLGHAAELHYEKYLKENNIKFEKERTIELPYEDGTLGKFYADFIVYDKIILEVKATASISDEFIARAINYLKVSGNKLALIINFGELKLNYKRIVL